MNGTATAQSIIFDLDGTLVDSEPYWAHGFSRGLSQIVSERGLGQFDLRPEDMQRFEGGRVPDTVKRVLVSVGLANLDPGTMQDIVGDVVTRVSATFLEDPKPITPAVEAAKYLAERGFTLGLASASAPSFIDAALTAIGLADVFPVRESAFALAKGKPDPEVYTRALDRLGSYPSVSLAIEDSPVGVGAALNAGMVAVWVKPEIVPVRGEWKSPQELRLSTVVREKQHHSRVLVVPEVSGVLLEKVANDVRTSNPNGDV